MQIVEALNKLKNLTFAIERYCPIHAKIYTWSWYTESVYYTGCTYHACILALTTTHTDTYTICEYLWCEKFCLHIITCIREKKCLNICALCKCVCVQQHMCVVMRVFVYAELQTSTAGRTVEDLCMCACVCAQCHSACSVFSTYRMCQLIYFIFGYRYSHTHRDIERPYDEYWKTSFCFLI